MHMHPCPCQDLCPALPGLLHDPVEGQHSLMGERSPVICVHSVQSATGVSKFSSSPSKSQLVPCTGNFFRLGAHGAHIPGRRGYYLAICRGTVGACNIWAAFGLKRPHPVPSLPRATSPRGQARSRVNWNYFWGGCWQSVFSKAQVSHSLYSLCQDWVEDWNRSKKGSKAREGRESSPNGLVEVWSRRLSIPDPPTNSKGLQRPQSASATGSCMELQSWVRESENLLLVL